MNTTRILAGDGTCHSPSGDVICDSILRDGEPYVRISNVDRMDPFFMSVVSDSDHWLFVGSNSPFTAGRTDPDHALFPYQTVDKILRHPDTSGTMTIVLLERPDGWARWEPWRPQGESYRLERNLYKHAHGTSVIFEEINHDLNLRFEYRLSPSEPFGFVRQCCIENLGDEKANLRILDGWQNLIPPEVDQSLYANISYLAAAYMRHERDPETGLGIFTLNAGISDRAEPCESLRSACAWSLGHDDPVVLLCERQVEAFRRGEPVQSENEVRGEFGAYLTASTTELAAHASSRWINAADTHLDHAQIISLRRTLQSPAPLRQAVEDSVAANAAGLRRRIAAADGLQHTADTATCVHHFANAMFNCMRGGTFNSGYELPQGDFAAFVECRSRSLYTQHQAWIEALPSPLSCPELVVAADAVGDPQLSRLAREYMPLTFSRRHGDPSRPWNRFAIHIKDQGKPVYAYEGNWRDIFQNWESLAWSFPAYLESMITIFLNASTADGYNPYRITRQGIDWETEDLEDPWSHIGYWGDHQIIYLLRLLETSERFFPNRLGTHLSEQRYAYARVPYEISGFDAIVSDPRHTITFNHELHETLVSDADELGADGRLHRNPTGDVVQVSLTEKLLVPVLAKLTNFVPEGGIWLNTQRPEWNDANNALAGYGLSMVTVCYLRRALSFYTDLFAAAGDQPVEMSLPVADLLKSLTDVFRNAPGQFSDEKRFQFMEAVGRAGETHRKAIYAADWSATTRVNLSDVSTFIDAVLPVIDATIRANRREDGLYHSYNILHLKNGTQASVETLYPMLEGQVAVTGSGMLTPDETLAIVHALRESDLYREDQHSYLLYPNRDLPSYFDRNSLPADARSRVPLLSELIAANNRQIVTMDEEGGLHFNADLTNAKDLQQRLREMDADEQDTAALLNLWEEVFNHRTFTGRSGTMFAFEGLGSIYWHMVAKLLVSVQEAHDEASGEVKDQLASAYDDVRKGLGFTKTPEVYGAFPSDPYSHSPGHRGAQQPGMTGQVKEELITRWGELGVSIEDGCLSFNPTLLPKDEFITEPSVYEYVDLQGRDQAWDLPASSLAFTFCQVPVCYRKADTSAVTLIHRDGTESRVSGSRLDRETSLSLFHRTGTITHILVDLP